MIELVAVHLIFDWLKTFNALFETGHLRLRRFSPNKTFRNLEKSMSAEGVFCLMGLTEISKLRLRIERQFSNVARATCHTTYMLHRESSFSLPGVVSSPSQSQGFNLDAYTRILGHHPQVPRPLSTDRRLGIMERVQKPPPLRGIFEVTCDSNFVLSPESFGKFLKYPPSLKPGVIDAADLDHRSAVSFFCIWRDMFCAGGRLSSFSATANFRDDLAVNITYEESFNHCIPELSMVFKTTSFDGISDSRRFSCLLNRDWFLPEQFSLGMLKVFTEQLVQLITANLNSDTQAPEIRAYNLDRVVNHPQKRPALEK